MDKNEFSKWENFLKTGSIDAYLSYKQCALPTSVVGDELGINQNGRNSNKRN